MPILSFTVKEIHIIMQLIRLAVEDGLDLSEYAKKSELEVLKNKLQNVKGV